FCTKAGLLCLDLASGKELWKKDVTGMGAILFAFADKVLLCVNGTHYTAISGADGAVAWTHVSPGKGEAYFAGGLVWVDAPDDRKARKTDGFHNPTGGEAHQWTGLDPASGEVRKTLHAPVALDFRCH